MRNPVSPLSLVLILVAFAALVALQVGQNPLLFALQSWKVNDAGISIPSVAANGPVAEIGPLRPRATGISLRIHLQFRIADSTGYQNLFQTDDVNSGIRVELNGTKLGIIAGDATGSRPPTGMILDSVRRGHWYDLELTGVTSRNLSARLDGLPARTRLPLTDFGTGNVRIGIGFDDTRRFHGDIRNATVDYGSLRSVDTLSQVLGVLIPLLEGILIVLFFRRLWKLDRHLRNNLKASLAARRRVQMAFLSYRFQALYFSVLVLIIAVVYNLVWIVFQRRYSVLAAALRPGFEFTLGVAHFKSEVILLALIELCFAGTIGIAWALKLVHVKPPRFLASSGVLIACCIASLAMYFIAPSFIARASLLLALILFALQFVARRLAAPVFVPRMPFVYCGPTILHLRQIALSTWRRVAVGPELPAGQSTIGELKAQRVWYSALPRLARVVFVGFCCLAAAPFLRSWFPVTLPNDYVEIADRFLVETPEGEKIVARSTMAACLPIVLRSRTEDGAETSVPPKCSDIRLLSDARLNDLTQVVANTAGWQGEAGRVLFHHSYIFVPAAHFLAYGLDHAIPYLYGYGNTIFQAVLMWVAGGPSLTAYFNTFPVAECLGLVAIAALIFQITGSFWAATTGFGLSLIAFYSITFSAVFLAASFNPLRFFGLVMQVSAMCFCARSNPRKSLPLIPLSAAFSLFWNTEFAQVGLVGQGLFLLMPTLSISLARRALFIVLLLGVTGTMMAVGRPTQDIVSTVELAFFNIWIPSMTLPDAITFFVALAVAHVMLIGLSRAFVRQEQMLRLAYIPVLALVLVKYVVNPSPPHLNLAYCFLLPMCLVYVPWRRTSQSSLGRRPVRFLPAAAAAVALGFAVDHGNLFFEQSEEFRRVLTRSMVSAPWHEFGETTLSVTPEQPISDRAGAIKTYLRKDDALLILSPFDQVLSFYANPKKYCGHFELMSNLATNEIMDAVLRCGLKSTQTLIVYDRAAEAPCPRDDLQSQSRCALKSSMKSNLTALRDRMLPRMHEIGMQGDLTFYRPTASHASGER